MSHARMERRKEMAAGLAAEVEEKRRKEAIEDLQWLMGNERGRRLLHRLLGVAGVYRSSMTGNSMTYFNEGARNVGQVFLSEVSEHCWDDYIKMQQEAKDNEVLDFETINTEND